MHLLDLLSPGRVIAPGPIPGKKRLLEKASGLLAEGNAELERAVFDSLVGRERLGSTGLGHGVAIPHARLPMKRRFICAVGRSSQGIIYDQSHQQPVHLVVKDLSLQKSSEYDVFAGPSTRYCPAGVYEWVEDASGPKFVINAQNCVHCKTCDIKDPTQNITWTPPEGGSGPNYTNM